MMDEIENKDNVFATTIIITLIVLALLKSIKFLQSNDDPWKNITLVGLIFCYCTVAAWWFDLIRLYFTLAMSMLITFLSPGLSKASKYRHESAMGSLYRKGNDALILTSAVYLIACLYAVMKNQFEMAFICGNTWLGSTIYHYNWESMYFNFDNVFAMSLAIVYGSTLWLSFGLNNEIGAVYFWSGILGSPVALFLLYYCGYQLVYLFLMFMMSLNHNCFIFLYL
mmetsp:Transcript_32720/g.47236  ORF Transcript_32720/g.47236 Transcript_32720/m.47236 type:complete len:225 (-) Transcript_32720:146-820(-)